MNDRSEERVDLTRLAGRLADVSGVVGVALGGSRARGEHTPDSDFDLGVYYRGRPDVAALARLAAEVSEPPATVSAPGEWGPWVDGGAWLRIDGRPVDWIYRDLDRVDACWFRARQGEYAFHLQTGHPLGFADFVYPGELACAQILADPAGALADRQAVLRTYPDALGEALVAGLWEARFLVAGARKAVDRNDAVYVSGMLFRIVGVCVHALHGRAGKWLLNEKGAVASAGRLPLAPAGFAERATRVSGRVGQTAAELSATLDEAERLVADTEAACR